MLHSRKLTKSFGGLNAVSDLTFDLDNGEILGLIGPNGAGKTTVFNLLTGVLKVTSGTVHLDNDNITNKPPHQITSMGITRTFQNLRLMKGMTMVENLKPAFHLNDGYNYLDSFLQTRRYREVEQGILDKIYETLELLQISKYAEIMVDDLAYGVLKKLELARALLYEPQILLLDEPAAGLNPIETDEIMDIIRMIHNRSKMGIIVVEHNMKVVMGISHRIIVMNQGSLIAQGVPSEIQSNEKVIKAYLGEKAWKKQAVALK
ncbi:MAG: ABC transporter ATP-binding protein [Aminobacterium colombiense]|jgi:branched-chain amino acid transport system ATP-binding protein|uniref:ABC transporter ATP-binding protein n=1 Tax=Aminobacterium colombiense TaxID=81468 RepID=UPI002A40308D|nr:ABC transporter ATP-binding protein [Aminobacterium colombiense]MDD4266040.1 ABC transporter ATP-binding protein [Aminobacterium colombiense]MDD4586558.1 ABC transporter ATP-binding protein [Aminobacterium colombiense]